MSADAATLFVFYEPGSSFRSWTYDYPRTWDWVGGGHTNPLGESDTDTDTDTDTAVDGDAETTGETPPRPSRRHRHTREDQFCGPLAGLPLARARLRGQLEGLVADDVIRSFQICTRYRPS